MVDGEREKDEEEGEREEEVELEVEDEHGEDGGDDHGGGDEEEARDVAAVLHDGGHDEPDRGLQRGGQRVKYMNIQQVYACTTHVAGRGLNGRYRNMNIQLHCMW